MNILLSRDPSSFLCTQTKLQRNKIWRIKNKCCPFACFISIKKLGFLGPFEIYLLVKNIHLIDLKFIYSEKAANFCKISTVNLSYVVTIKSTVEITQNFVAFSEYIYSRVQKSIENWSAWSKMALGEVGVPLPWWCHPLVLLAPGYWRLFLNLIIFS